MASISSNNNAIFSFLLLSIILSVSVIQVCQAQPRPPTVRGLSYTFYSKTCPTLKSIVRTELKKVFKNDIAQAAGLLRIHFHDCFVQVINQTLVYTTNNGEKVHSTNINTNTWYSWTLNIFGRKNLITIKPHLAVMKRSLIWAYKIHGEKCVWCRDVMGQFYWMDLQVGRVRKMHHQTWLWELNLLGSSKGFVVC